MPSSSPAAGLSSPPIGRDAVVRFAGDSGDGIMLAGQRFAAAAAQFGCDVHTLPLPPSEIRAPSGSPFAVTAYQVRIGNRRLHTPGDVLDLLVAMNPASLKLHLPDLAPGGRLIINTDTFDAADLEKAGYASNPLDDLNGFDVIPLPFHRINREAVASVNLLSPREADRSRNLCVLGLACALYGLPIESTLQWIRDKFSKNRVAVDANTQAVHAGHALGHSFVRKVAFAPMTRPAGKHRRVTGHEVLSLGLVAAAYQLKKNLVFASTPILPANDLQQHLIDLRNCGVRTIVAEDEAAAAGMALGAAFAGSIGVTATTGPGLCRMSETIGLAAVSELPLVVIDVMRAGAGNGIPNASDQADLLSSLFGRNGDCPVVVLAPTSPAHAFDVAALAVRLAVQAMTPVIVLTDTHLGPASMVWRVPTLNELPEMPWLGSKARPFQVGEEGVRPWVPAGTPGGEHRLSGLEHEDQTGRVSFDPANHEAMTRRRADKIARLAADVPPAEWIGPTDADVVFVGWGRTCGAIREAVESNNGVAGILITSLHPLPSNLGDLLGSARRVVVAEANEGQLALLLRARWLIDAERLNVVRGRPIRASDLTGFRG